MGRRGRPRDYDRDVALDAALNLFWAHGYDGASLAELAEAMEMNRPSVYAAFGSKAALFTEAMSLFTDRLRAHAQDALSRPELEDALRELFMGLIDIYRPRGEGRGCLVFGVGSACSVDDSFGPIVARALFDLERALQRRFGQGPSSAARASLAASMVHSLSVRARAGRSRKALVSFVDRCVPLLL